MFLYPKFNKNGEKVIARIGGRNKEMLMDISVFQLPKGKKKTFFQIDKEIAILLISGKIRIVADKFNEEAERKSLFTDLPTTLHVCKDGNTKKPPYVFMVVQ